MGRTTATATNVPPASPVETPPPAAVDAAPQPDERDAHIARLEAELAAMKSAPSKQTTGRKTREGYRWVTPRFDHETRYGERTYIFKADVPIELPNEVADWVTGEHGGVKATAFYVSN